MVVRVNFLFWLNYKLGPGEDPRYGGAAAQSLAGTSFTLVPAKKGYSPLPGGQFLDEFEVVEPRRVML